MSDTRGVPAESMGSGSRRLATIDEAARLLRCSAKTVRRRIADGSMTGYRFGPRAIRVDLDELDCQLRTIPSADRRQVAGVKRAGT